MPALSTSQAAPYVAGAYVVFVALILIYVVIMAGRLSRIERQLTELVASGDGAPSASEPPAGEGASA